MSALAVLLALVELALAELPLADEAALDEPPDEQPTRASAATITATAAKTMYLLAFITGIPPSLESFPWSASFTHLSTIAQNALHCDGARR